MKISFAQAEQFCSNTFSNNNPFWHVCTTGKLTEILCETPEDFKFCVTLIAIAASYAKVKVISFEVMSNHIHVLLAGCTREDCLNFFNYYKAKLHRYYLSTGRYKNLSGFTTDPIPLPTLESVRREIVYIARNGFLASDKYLPYSYPWGTGSLYFNPMSYTTDAQSFSAYPSREKQKMCHGRIPDLPDTFLVKDGMILPQSFCCIKLGEALFRSPHQYFSMVSKNYEAYSEVAKRLGDDIFLDDEDMFAVLLNMCRRKYNDSKPTLLPQRDKLDVARLMKKDYNASDGQIQRMLKLDRSVVEELFGH